MATALRHPWASLRSREKLTQEEVADKLGISRHMIIRLEQSLFAHPPVATTKKLGEIYGISAVELNKDYYEYVKNTRRIFRDKHDSLKQILRVYDFEENSTHPLEFYREAEGLSRIGFCKGICVHQDSILDYEKNRQRGLPEQLKEALEELGWDWYCLELAVKDWRIKWR